MEFKNKTLGFKFEVIFSVIFFLITVLQVNTAIECLGWADGYPDYCNLPMYTFLSGILAIPLSPPMFVVILVPIFINPAIGFLLGKILGSIIEKAKR